MRELTGKELDAVCGGLFDFTAGNLQRTFYKPTPWPTVPRQFPDRVGKRAVLRRMLNVSIQPLRSSSRWVSHTPPLRRRSVQSGLGSSSWQSLVGQHSRSQDRRLRCVN